MKWFVAVLCALVLVLNYRIWLSPAGTSEVMRLKEAVASNTQKTSGLRCATSSLRLRCVT